MCFLGTKQVISSHWIVGCTNTMVNFSNRRPSLIEATIGQRLLQIESCFFSARESLSTVHLIPWVCLKIIKIIMYWKLAKYVLKLFFKVTNNVCFSAQNVLDPLLSLHMYFFIPKVLLNNQKMLNLRNLRRVEND